MHWLETGQSTRLEPFTPRSSVNAASRVACLSKYVWGWLKVRRRTYYAFMPGNGVKEYAAELALDYLREQRAVLAGRRVKRPFKCGPPKNARSWKLMADFFFAGVDFLPACER